MKNDIAINCLSALAQPTRLDAFRILVKHEPGGLPAGDIARQLDVPHNTLSAHLNILLHAKLISVERHSRSMIYRVELKTIRKLVVFLLRDCCNGQEEICRPLIQDLVSCCAPSGGACA